MAHRRLVASRVGEHRTLRNRHPLGLELRDVPGGVRFLPRVVGRLQAGQVVAVRGVSGVTVAAVPSGVGDLPAVRPERLGMPRGVELVIVLLLAVALAFAAGWLLNEGTR